MHLTDFDAFRGELGKLAVMFGKDMSDQLVAGYWEALKDLPLSTVQAGGATHAKFGKFFPKPRELRPKDDAPKVTRDPQAIRDGEKRANERLEWLRTVDGDEWLKQVRPKVTELGRARGMTDGEIESKLHRYLQEGPR